MGERTEGRFVGKGKSEVRKRKWITNCEIVACGGMVLLVLHFARRPVIGGPGGLCAVVSL